MLSGRDENELFCKKSISSAVSFPIEKGFLQVHPAGVVPVGFYSGLIPDIRLICRFANSPCVIERTSKTMKMINPI